MMGSPLIKIIRRKLKWITRKNNIYQLPHAKARTRNFYMPHVHEDSCYYSFQHRQKHRGSERLINWPKFTLHRSRFQHLFSLNFQLSWFQHKIHNIPQRKKTQKRKKKRILWSSCKYSKRKSMSVQYIFSYSMSQKEKNKIKHNAVIINPILNAFPQDQILLQIQTSLTI